MTPTKETVEEISVLVKGISGLLLAYLGAKGNPVPPSAKEIVFNTLFSVVVSLAMFLKCPKYAADGLRKTAERMENNTLEEIEYSHLVNGETIQ